jgi:hypothetical protein
MQEVTIGDEKKQEIKKTHNQKHQARQTINAVQDQEKLHHPNQNLRKNFGKPSENLRVHIQH